MLKVITLISRKPGMTREEFRQYYEMRHAPLAKKLFPQFLRYKRNYVDLDGAILFPGAPAPDFDSVTEIWFKDRASYDAMLASHAENPAISAEIDADEAKFMDRSKTRFFIVDEAGDP